MPPEIGGSFNSYDPRRRRGEETGIGDQRPIAPSPFSSFGSPDTFKAAATTQANDYDTIMKNYANILQNTSTSPISSANVTPQNVSSSGSYTPQDITAREVAPQTSQYRKSADVTGSLANLSDLAATGGYSQQGISDLRARGIAPTRSIYANAQQNVERQRALAGGYSPNFNAVQAQMARDESQQIGDINTNVNAGIAQNVAGNRIAAASPYAAASGAENQARTESERHNADIVNQINQSNAERAYQAAETNKRSIDANAQAQFDRAAAIGSGNANRNLQAQTTNVNNTMNAQNANRGNALAATQGQASLYGTTPALTNTFGNQVTQAAQVGQGQQHIDAEKQRNLYGFIGRNS